MVFWGADCTLTAQWRHKPGVGIQGQNWANKSNLQISYLLSPASPVGCLRYSYTHLTLLTVEVMFALVFILLSQVCRGGTVQITTNVHSGNIQLYRNAKTLHTAPDQTKTCASASQHRFNFERPTRQGLMSLHDTTTPCTITHIKNKTACCHGNTASPARVVLRDTTAVNILTRPGQQHNRPLVPLVVKSSLWADALLTLTENFSHSSSPPNPVETQSESKRERERARVRLVWLETLPK